MSVYGNTNTRFVIGMLVGAVVAMTAWCGYALWGQMRTERIQTQMRTLCMAVAGYAKDNGGQCPEDLGVLLDGRYGADGRLYRIDAGAAQPKTAADVRAGLCDFAYLGKGMKITASSAKKDGRDDARAFPLLYLKEPFRGEWLVVYSDARPEAYESKPGFLK